MSRRAQRSGGGLTDGLPIEKASSYGAIAYLLGYAVTFAFIEIESENSILESDESLFESVGWLFYNAHFVDTVVTQNGDSRTVNTLSKASDMTIPEPIWYLVPIAALALAGYAVARQRGSGRTTDAMVAGATVTAGYLPLATAGAFLFEVNRSQETVLGTVEYTASPDTTMAVALAGVAFPLVCGAAGGFVHAVQSGSGAGASARGGRQQGSLGGRQQRRRGGQQRQRGSQRQQGDQQRSQKRQGDQQRQSGRQR